MTKEQSMEMHSYSGMHDLHVMLDLLAEGRRAGAPTYYAHRGDLQWWLFYTYIPEAAWQSSIRLWMEDDQLIGFALLAPELCSFDVFVHPRWRCTSREEEMLELVLAEMAGLDELQTIWIAEDDNWRIKWLEANGFQHSEDYFYWMTRDLSGPLVGPGLPEGFTTRHSRGEQDAHLRSVASAAAFESSKPFDEYVERTLRFVRSPVYTPEYELYVIGPDGNVASFCITWTDTLNKMGLFEPVGTHPDFQGKSLGKSLLFEGMRLLKAEGMQEASLCTTHDNLRALRLYESAGFQKVKRLLTFSRKRRGT
jgi:mycothiol synthase